MLWVLFISLVIACQAITENQVQEQWKLFLNQTQKLYESLEAVKRQSIFKDNLEKIKAHNTLFQQGKVGYEMGVTQFADWTTEEFLRYLGNNKRRQKRIETPSKRKFNVTVPESIDWREKGAVTAVEDQKNCGAGWSFSATGSLESQALIKRNQRFALSEQNLIDCAGSKYFNDGCKYGYADGAFDYVKVHGIDSEEHYPYRKRKHLFCRQHQAVFKIRSYQAVERSEEALQAAVAEIGPISAGIDATHKLQHYKSGVFEDDRCGQQTNHNVLVVGFGYEAGKEYWILKNSWGTRWGEDGYFRLLRNAGACAIVEDAWYPII